LVDGRARRNSASLLRDVLRVPNLSEGAYVMEAVGDVLDGYEGEDA
jgi:hypothetical protein